MSDMTFISLCRASELEEVRGILRRARLANDLSELLSESRCLHSRISRWPRACV